MVSYEALKRLKETDIVPFEELEIVVTFLYEDSDGGRDLRYMFDGKVNTYVKFYIPGGGEPRE